MKSMEKDLQDVYQHLIDKGASQATALEATLALARDLMPDRDDSVIRETVQRLIVESKTQRSPP